MFKKLIILAASLLAFCAPLSAGAQVFNQSQVLTSPYGGPGFIVSTTTGVSGKLQATSTPFFSNFYFGTGNGNTLCLSGVCMSSWPSTGGTFPFTPSTNYGVNTSATSTAIYDSAGLIASSTSYFSNINAQYASTTNLETVLYANEFPGSDIGAKINAAYAALPSTGGKIVVPSGSYSFSTPISFATNQKVVLLSCPSGGGASNNAVGGTTLTFSATTGSAITINTNNYIVAGVGIENCNVQGTNGTTARTTVGINIGGTNGGFNQLLNGVNVNGFGTGVQYNSNTSFDTIENSTIHFNGRNVDEPDTSGANGENMRILNSVIADSNNQAGGATDLFCVAFQESGNVQWQLINTSVDDCQVYLNQFGGTANILTLTSDHFENPNTHTYDYINMLSNTPADEVVVQGGDMMNDVVGGMPEYISSGGDIVLTGVMINSNSPVTTPVTRVVKNLNATNIDSVTWTGLLSNGKGATYVSDYIPFSPVGQATGLGVVFNIGSSTPTRQGNLGVGTTSIIGQFAKFALQLNSINDNYSSAFAIGSSTASATTTLFSISNTGSTTAANGFNITAGCYALNGTCISSAVSNTFGKTWEIIAGLFGANVLSPTTTIPIYVPGTGTSTIENLAGVLDASAFTGSDIGTQVNNAYAAAPAGATITIPVGNYTTATSINFNTNGKGVTLNCAIGTVITYSGTGDLIDYNIGQTGGAGSSLNNCHLYGSGTTTASVAVRIGGTNGARNFTMNNVQIENFGSTTSSGAVTTGDNAYILNFNNDFVHHNGKDFYDGSATNAGENDNFTGGTWADCRPIGTNCVDFPTASTASVRFSDVSIDDAALHIGAIVRSVTINGGHFENPAGDNFPKYTPITIDSSLNTSVTIEGTAFLNGANANRASQFISNGGNLTLIGITGEDYGGGTKGVGALVTNTGNGYTRIYSTSNQDGAWQQFFNSTSGSGAPQYVQAENGFVGLGTSSPQFNFVVATSTPLGQSPRIEVDGLSNGVATSTPGYQISVNSIRKWLLFDNTDDTLRFRSNSGVDGLTLDQAGDAFFATTTTGCATFASDGLLYPTGVACGSGSGGSVGNWFTPTTNFGVNMNATSTPVWFQNGLFASTTSTIQNTTFAGVNVGIGTTSPGNSLVLSTTTALGASPRIQLDGWGTGSATSSVGIDFTTKSIRDWLVLNLGTDRSFQIRNNAGTPVIKLTQAGAFLLSTSTAGCAQFASTGELFSGTCASGGTGAYPFTPTTNFGSLAQATTGIPWFQNGLQASSTSQFGQTVFSGPVTGGFFLSTTTLASKPVYAVGNDSTTGIGIGASTGGLNFYGSGNAHFQITSAGPGSTFAFGPSFSSSQGPELIDTNGSDSIPSLYFTGSGYGLWYDGSLEVSGGGNRLATFGGSSITFAQPFTVNTGKLSTLNGGFLSTASSTVNGQFAVSTSTQGCATFGVGGVLYSTGTACGTGGGGSVGNWFTPDSNFAALTNSTSTPVWFKSGLQASSTSEFANANFTGSVGINTFAPAVALDVNGSIRAYQPGGTAIIKASDSTNSNYTQMYNTGTNGELESTNTFVLSAPSGVFVTGTNNPQLRVQFGSGSFHSGTFYDDDSNFFIGTNAGAIILQPTTNVQFPFASSTAQTLTTLYSTLASTTNLTVNIPNCNTTSALTTNAAGVVACGAISGSGGSVGNWFTPTTYGNATSTTIGFNLGLLSIGSTTVNGVLHLPLSNGGLAVNGGAVYSTPTTTLSAGSNITLTPSGNNIQIAASGGSGQSPYSWVVAASGGDYTTIQAALTQCGAVGGGDIILTDPLYNQGGTGLTWRGSNCHIEGRGLGTTTINFTGATTYFKTNSAAGQYSNNSIDGITISGDGNASGVVFDLSDMSHFGLTHTTSDDVGTWIKINDTQNVSFYDDIEHNQATTIVAFGINASSTNPVNGDLFQDNFIGCNSSGCVGIQLDNANGDNFTSNYIEPNITITNITDIKIFDNTMATNNGVFNDKFDSNYLEGGDQNSSIGISIAKAVDPGGGIQRNLFINNTDENHAPTGFDYIFPGAATSTVIALQSWINNYDSNFGNPLTSFGTSLGVGTSTELANINNPPYAALAVSANTSLVTQEFVVANSTANRTDLIVNATGGVLLPNLVSQTCLGTSATGLIQTGTCSGGSAFPFTPTTDFAVNTSATSTPIWARLGLFASSTSVIGTTTFASNGFVGFGTSTPEAPITFAQKGGLLNPDFIIDGVNGLTGAEMELNRGSNTGTEEANIDFNTNSTEFWQLGMQDNSTNDFELWDGSDDPAFTVKTSTNAIGFGTTTPFGDFAINADFGDALPGNLIFNVASSTATATTTLFSISNVGNVVHRILNSFSITDTYGTQDVAINTASTTGSIFTVAATTSPSLVAPIKLFDVDQYGHLTASSTRATPAVSSCGTGSGTLSANANDVTGTVTTATAATACTITFSSAYATLPSVVVSGASLVGFPSVTAVSTSAFTIGISAAVTGDAITYIVITP